jgi:acetyl esterase/lipase
MSAQSVLLGVSWRPLCYKNHSHDISLAFTTTQLNWTSTMNRMVIAAIALIAVMGPGAQQVRCAQPMPLDPVMGITTLPLWDRPVPGSPAGSSDSPTLTVFPPQPGKGNGTAVIVAPGGAYIGLASNLEGRQVADWFASRGITAFVLKYRLGSGNLYPIPLQDAQRAVRVVRSFDKRYGLASSRVGIIGFSAGGHLAATAATLFDTGSAESADPVERLSDRPDFLILGYPWLNAMQPNDRHLITYCSMIPSIPADRCKTYERQYTPSLHVSQQTPPAFIYGTSDDEAVPVNALVDFYTALTTAGVQAELHIFHHGSHGSGLGSGDAALDVWPTLLEQWLRDQGLLTPDPATVAAQKAAMYVSARRPGEPLTLESPLYDIVGDAGGAAIVNRICGEKFLQSLPAAANGVSLQTLAPYFPSQLSEKNLAKIQSEFAKLSINRP